VAGARQGWVGLLLVLALLLAGGCSPPALLDDPVAPASHGGKSWQPFLQRAKDYAQSRQGIVALGVVDDHGKLHGHRLKDPAPAASVFKVMLLATYLRMPSVRHRNLTEYDRNLLGPMIRWSDNTTASKVRNIVGAKRIHNLAHDANMREFRLEDPWGLSQTSARDQARFMFRLEDYIPNRHDPYARNLLSHIVPSQRWGIPKVTPDGWTIFFKGGWGTGTGRVTHQVAFLEMGEARISLAVLIEFSPSHSHGTWTVRGVAKRLLKYVA
jgi:beta-lactamase class A